jgi:hypothetical protein
MRGAGREMTYHLTVHVWIDAKDKEDAQRVFLSQVPDALDINIEDVEAEEWEPD